MEFIPDFGGLAFTLVAFIAALSIIVAIHEYGHYIVGRWSGIHAEVFSVGFGPVLFSRVDRHGTKWQIAALPFGGYVKFLGDADAASGKDGAAIDALDVEERRRSMHGAPLWARSANRGGGSDLQLHPVDPDLRRRPHDRGPPGRSARRRHARSTSRGHADAAVGRPDHLHRRHARRHAGRCVHRGARPDALRNRDLRAGAGRAGADGRGVLPASADRAIGLAAIRRHGCGSRAGRRDPLRRRHADLRLFATARDRGCQRWRASGPQRVARRRDA